MLAAGEPQLWLTGGALALCVAMILGLLALVFFSGLSTFWPAALLRVQLRDGTVYLGEVTRDEVPVVPRQLGRSAELAAAEARRRLQKAETTAMHGVCSAPATSISPIRIFTGSASSNSTPPAPASSSRPGPWWSNAPSGGGFTASRRRCAAARRKPEERRASDPVGGAIPGKPSAPVDRSGRASGA